MWNQSDKHSKTHSGVGRVFSRLCTATASGSGRRLVVVDYGLTRKTDMSFSTLYEVIWQPNNDSRSLAYKCMKKFTEKLSSSRLKIVFLE
ncbi:hypothetical protein [Oryza sativa Japonica Group]|uniref:Uncharacterized protein n=1 Tax=Oryza sativa subsp. japonica TaxID=39947 RepID=Q8RZU1_ORYSJ|nr:hypothetical protein [Oryza sativa Japonica Group]